jgi:DNA-directed RNA polymerase specialized sigma24 family protein
MTNGEERTAVEARIRALCDAGEKQRAATLLLETYGRELLLFLVSRLRDEDAAREAFSRFTEDLWRGLTGFCWQCTARVWCYTLARHAGSRQIRELRKRRRGVALSRAGALSQIEERIRTRTRTSARTAARNLIASMRERLSTDDQMLLILRVEQKLAWTEIAQVLLHDGAPTDEAVLQKDAVRLRKRYQAAKERLQKLAADAGMRQSRGD